MTRSARALASFFIAAFAVPSALRAQVRASELASVSQTIDGTKLTITYSRPSVRGRDSLFGNPKVVRWGEVWTPGANWATTLEVSRPVHIAGQAVKQGTYSVWMVVRPSREWTLVLDPNAKLFHMAHPDSNAAQIRAPIRMENGPFTELLTWSFPAVRATGGSLVLQWATARVVLDVAVEPSLSVTMPQSEAAPYLGRYDYSEVENGTTKRSTFIVSYENGTLKGEWDPMDRYMKRFALLRIAPDWFAPGLYDEKGEIYEVLRPDNTFEFTRASGRATRVEVRGEDDTLYGSATRKP
jgi:hypothetical protein